MTKTLPWLLVLAIACTAAPVMADEAGDKRALELFKESEAAYDQGRFKDAIALLREAYTLKKESVLLYNLGRAYEGVGDLEGAIAAYEKFLVAEPKTPDRGALEQRIVTMRGQIQQRERLEKERADSEKPAPPREPQSNTPWFVAGAGAAVVASGSILGGLALSKHDDALAEPSHERASEIDGDSRDLQRWANVALVTGGTLLAIGLAWGLLRGSGGPSKPTAAAFVVRFP